MTQPITLLLGVHAHQPVGNFTEVIDEAHVRCYGKFFEVLEDYPEFRFAAHFSGWLLDVLAERHPRDMERIAAMTRRGQVEWFGSGDCEPVLAAIPYRDRVTQIVTLSDKLEQRFGMRPKGAWLTERVWESSVVGALAESGIEYVAVDDYHFLCTGRDGHSLDGYYTTEEGGTALDLFPISEAARYRLPFSPAEETVAWLEGLALQGQRAAIYFDDIEKFGIWPETYEWVYEKGWLTKFVEGVLASPLIRTGTYEEFHAANRTRGVVYLPTTSYIEMNEWTLPAPAAREYHALLEDEKAAGRFERRKPFLRGGIWRNFFSRYPESNWMHKRMLAASARFAALPHKQQTAERRELLHRCQANDAYWHGLFGGLYLPHLRRAIWNNLLALEADLDRLSPRPAVSRGDIDHDGREEIVLHGDLLQAVVRDDGDAAIIEFDAWECAHNFGDTLRRYDEAYHDKLDRQADATAAGEGIASAHDRIAFLHEIAPGDAEPDSRPRGLFVEQWIDGVGHEHAIAGYRLAATSEREGAATFVADVDGMSGGRITKRIELSGRRLTVRLAAENLGGILTTRVNLAMPSCDGFLGRYVLASGEIPGGFGDPLELEGATQLGLEDGVLGGRLRLLAALPAALRARPHRTVSQSEAGFEKVMQAVELTLSWPLAPEAEQVLTLEFEPLA
jgi:alpha-amylase